MADVKVPDPVFIRTGGDREMFRVTPVRVTPSWFEANVEQVVSWEEEKDGGGPAEYEPYLNIIIKGDSCAHLRFGENERKDGYMHFCGAQYFRQHVYLMKELYDLAFRMMGRDPQPDERWDDD